MSPCHLVKLSLAILASQRLNLLDIAGIDKAGAGEDVGGGAQAVADAPAQPLHDHVALDVGLLINAEEGRAILDVGDDLRAEVEGAVDQLALQPFRFDKGVERGRAIGA